MSKSGGASLFRKLKCWLLGHAVEDRWDLENWKTATCADCRAQFSLEGPFRVKNEWGKK